MIRVADKSECCGCSACASACPKRCITMEFDAEGCEYPRVDEGLCIGCGKCERVCPELSPVPEKEHRQRAFLVQHRDGDVLAQSTSGGAFTALAQAVIAGGGIVFGAGYLRGEGERRAAGAPSRLKVGHFGVDDERDLWRFRNSKYTQSVIGPAFREVRDELRGGREVLFIGTPCQCEGLLSFLGRRPANLRVADVVCHAVPARAVFARYLEWLDARVGSEAGTVLFRDKARFGYRYSNMRALPGAGEPTAAQEREVLYSEGVETDPYLRAFFSDICDRPSCYSCAFKKRYRESDLTCWDFFDVYRLSKEFDDNRGVTRVLVQSEAGQELLDRAARYVKVEEVDADAIVEGAREMVSSVKANPRREAFMADVAEMDGPSLVAKWFPDSGRVKAERLARQTLERLGIYDQVKRAAKKVLGK